MGRWMDYTVYIRQSIHLELKAQSEAKAGGHAMIAY
jgi:hypothetical protein